MDTYLGFALGILFLSLLSLVKLYQLLRILISKQIDEQIEEMIPIKTIRKRVGIRIKWRK